MFDNARVILLLVLPVVAPARALAELPRVAVLDFKSVGGLSDDLISAFSEKLLVAIRATGEYREIGESDFEVMLGYESFKQTLGCDDDGCLAEIAGAAGVGLLLTGTVIEDGGSYTVLAKLLDTGEAAVVGRIEHRVDGGAAALLAAAQVVVAKVLGREVAPVVDPVAVGTSESGSGRGLHQVLGWTGVGVGAAALVTGALMLSSASSHKSAADDIYSDRYQPADTAASASDARSDIEAEIDSYNSRLTVGVVALGVGAAAVGFGLFELLTLPEPAVVVTTDGRGVVLTGWF